MISRGSGGGRGAPLGGALLAPLAPGELSVQADPGAGALLWRPSGALSIARDPCVQAGSGQGATIGPLVTMTSSSASLEPERRPPGAGRSQLRGLTSKPRRFSGLSPSAAAPGRVVFEPRGKRGHLRVVVPVDRGLQSHALTGSRRAACLSASRSHARQRFRLALWKTGSTHRARTMWCGRPARGTKRTAGRAARPSGSSSGDQWTRADRPIFRQAVGGGLQNRRCGFGPP